MSEIDTKQTDEVLGDTAPMEETFKVEQPVGYAPQDPFDAFGGSVALTTTTALNLSQFRAEISRTTNVPEDQIQVAVTREVIEEPISKDNEAHVYVRIDDQHGVPRKALAKILADHEAQEDPAPTQSLEASSVSTVESEHPELVTRLRSGDTLTTKELSSVLSTLLG